MIIVPKYYGARLDFTDGFLLMNEQLSMAFRIRLHLVKMFDVLCRIPRWWTLGKVLRRASEANDDFFFVQIGANDGVIYDPVWPFVKRYGWSGIMVEPVPVYFEKLKKNYAGSRRILFENVAISDRREIRDFYRVRDDVNFLPQWCNGLGTFNLDILLSHKWAIPNLEDYVVKESVECIPFKDLLEKHAVDRVNLLLIDTEGYDYSILKQLDFERIRPDILLYEHEYIDKDQRREFESDLRSRGYVLSKHLGNTLGYSRSC